MNIITNLKNYFKAKSKGDETIKTPDGVCPNCWGKQEWDGDFYKKIKVNNITPEHKTYDSFIHEVASKLDKITLKEDILICQTCNISYKK